MTAPWLLTATDCWHNEPASYFFCHLRFLDAASAQHFTKDVYGFLQLLTKNMTAPWPVACWLLLTATDCWHNKPAKVFIASLDSWVLSAAHWATFLSFWWACNFVTVHHWYNCPKSVAADCYWHNKQARLFFAILDSWVLPSHNHYQLIHVSTQVAIGHYVSLMLNGTDCWHNKPTSLLPLPWKPDINSQHITENMTAPWLLLLAETDSWHNKPASQLFAIL